MKKGESAASHGICGVSIRRIIWYILQVICQRQKKLLWFRIVLKSIASWLNVILLLLHRPDNSNAFIIGGANVGDHPTENIGLEYQQIEFNE